MKRGNWYAITALQTDSGVVAEVRIYDEIGFWGVTAKDFIAQLDAAAANASQVLVAINSPGGDVTDAFAIYNALRRYAGKVVTRVDSIAASAATIPLMAGDTIVMPENAMLMIHELSTVAVGTSDDLRGAADMMDKMRDSVVAAYASRTGQTPEAIQQMMKDTTWMTASEAKELGFADEIEQPVRLAASINAVGRLARYQGAPQAFIEMIEEADASAATTSTTQTTVTPPAGAANEDPPLAPVSTTPVDATMLATHVFTMCRSAGVSNLAEPIIMSCGLKDQASVDARISSAREIAGLCVAAKLPEATAEYVSSGLNVEQVRARLFDRVTAQAAAPISTHQRPQAESTGAAAGLSSASIYASRRQSVQSIQMKRS